MEVFSIYREHPGQKVKESCTECIEIIRTRLIDIPYESFQQCASVCEALIQNQGQDYDYFEKLALLGIGLCEECAELCDTQSDLGQFARCAAFCRKYSEYLSEQVFGPLLVAS